MSASIKKSSHRKSTLKDHFPMIRDRKELLAEIHADPNLHAKFLELQRKGWHEEFLNMCCGNRGVKILYDTFFKRIFNTEDGKDNLIHLLSALLRKEITDVELLPLASGIGADGNLVVMDLVVRLSDGSMVNVEVQKHGYLFPGARAACYSADLLLRQYAKIKAKSKMEAEYARKRVSEPDSSGIESAEEEAASAASKNDKTVVNYSLLRPVLTIVLIENSTKIFKGFPDTYIHKIKPTSDTGIEIDLLQEYIFIPLDIFLPILQDRGIRDEQDAWIALLASDDPAIILKLIETYPDLFLPIYGKLYSICRNTEEAMNMFSEALRTLDENTVLYMIDEYKKEVEDLSKQVREYHDELRRRDDEIQRLREELARTKALAGRVD